MTDDPVTDYHAIAEKWAGPHEGCRYPELGPQGCRYLEPGRYPELGPRCDCPRRERVVGIEKALREAEKAGRTAGVEAELASHEAEVEEGVKIG